MAKIQKLQQPTLPEGGRLWDESDERNRVYVELDVIQTWQGDVDPDDSWDRPDTAQSFRGVEAWAAKPETEFTWRYESFPVREPVSSGDDVYVVIVQYTTGDTFGTDSGNCAVVGVEVNEYMAEALEEKARARANGDYSYDQNGNSIELEGWSYYMGSWLGYFEHIERVFTERVRLR